MAAIFSPWANLGMSTCLDLPGNDSAKPTCILITYRIWAYLTLFDSIGFYLGLIDSI